MLFLCRYTLSLDNVPTAMAKRLEFEEMKPEGMRMICEYAVHGSSDPISGVMVFEADDVEVLNFLVLYWGKTATLDIRPCSDVLSAISLSQKSIETMR